jgi:sugar O-acyltransferase (sialic acid O-acetyltransferase NeuD family)
MSKELTILGAGGHTRSLIPLIEENGYKVLDIYDDSFIAKTNEFINGIAIKGKLNDLNYKNPVVLSFGDGQKRKNLAYSLDKFLLKDNIVHNSAIICSNVIIGNMNQVFAGAIINSNVKIGINNIINTGAIIEHEVVIGDYNHISVGSIIAGRVKIGNNCFIGAGAVIIDKLKITNNVIIGANSVVIRDIIEPGTYVGNPAKKIK